MLLLTTKYYSDRTTSIQYYSVLQSITKYYSDRTTSIQYYKVLLRQNDVHPVLLRTPKSTTPTERRPSSTTPYYKVLPRQNDIHPVLLRTTKYIKALLRQNDVHPVLLRTTKYHKVLLRQNDVHPVLLLTTKYYSDRTTSIQYYSVLQSTTQTERRPSSILPRTSYYKVLLRQNDVHPLLLRTTKYYSDLQNDVRTTSILYFEGENRRFPLSAYFSIFTEVKKT